MDLDLRGRSLLKEIGFSAAEFGYLIDLGAQLRAVGVFPPSRRPRGVPGGRPPGTALL